MEVPLTPYREPEVLKPMVDTQIETPIHKVSSEFVDRATTIIIRLSEQIDNCCPSCREIILKGILKT